MLKYDVKYVDYNNEKVEKTFYFNINKLELMKLQVSVDGGLDTKLTKMIMANDYAEILKFFTEIVKLAYGEKSDDGQTFVKSEKLSDAFVQSAAFEQMCNDFFFSDEKTGTDKVVNFINGIIPQDMRKKAEAVTRKKK